MREKRNHPAIDDTRCKHGFRNHGGLTPAALDSRSDFRRIMPDSRGVPSYRSRQKRPPLQAPIAPTAGSRPPLLITGPIFAECCPTPAAHRRSASDKTLAVASANRTHGGLTPAALVNVRLCIPKIAIRPTHCRYYSTRSGGRQPPVANTARPFRETHICNSVRTCNQERGASASRGAGVGHARETQSPRDRRYPLQTRFPKPRRAHARRSCFDSRDSPDTIRCALPARPNATHGGLTPAALVNVRLCIPKIAIRPTHGRYYSTRSGGRKPPVANTACRCSETHICNRVRTCNQERSASAPRGKRSVPV
jgi:hypothetical protein